MRQWESNVNTPLMGIRGITHISPYTHSEMLDGSYVDEKDVNTMDLDEYKTTRGDFEILQGLEDEVVSGNSMDNLFMGGGQSDELKWNQVGLVGGNDFNMNKYKSSGLESLLGSYGSPTFESSPSFFGSNVYGSSSNLYGGSSNKKMRLPVLHLQGSPLLAPSIETKPVTSYVIREQPIKSPRTIIQPIIHQRLIEQPITKTRIITQPVIRRLITQPIMQPHLIKTTNIRQKIIDQPITVPKIIRQDIVKQVLVEQPQTNKVLTRPTIVERRQPKLSTVFMGKQSPRGLTMQEAQLAAHPMMNNFNENNENLKFNMNTQQQQYNW